MTDGGVYKVNKKRQWWPEVNIQTQRDSIVSTKEIIIWLWWVLKKYKKMAWWGELNIFFKVNPRWVELNGWNWVTCHRMKNRVGDVLFTVFP